MPARRCMNFIPSRYASRQTPLSHGWSPNSKSCNLGGIKNEKRPIEKSPDSVQAVGKSSARGFLRHHVITIAARAFFDDGEARRAQHTSHVFGFVSGEENAFAD